jgi:hypothetical protein
MFIFLTSCHSILGVKRGDYIYKEKLDKGIKIIKMWSDEWPNAPRKLTSFVQSEKSLPISLSSRNSTPKCL